MHDSDDEPAILDRVDNSVVAHADPPKVVVSGQAGGAGRPGIVRKIGNFAEDAGSDLPVQPLEVLASGRARPM